MIEFPDVSHYTQVSLTGAVAAVAKCSQGIGYLDPFYDRFRRQADALKIPFSGYHWIDTNDPVAQARHYHANAAGAPCMWDAEADGATVPRILAATAELKALGGHAWGAYLPHWWWQGHLGSPDLRPLVAAGLVLVSSDYRTTPPGTGWQPYGGVTPTVWQYTDHQVLNGVPCDYNRYPGTVAQLAALFAGTAPPSLARREVDMPGLFQIKGNDTLYLSDGFRRKTLTLQMWTDFKETWGNVPIASCATQADLDAIAGPDWATLAAGVAGPTAAQIATAVVDEEHARLAD